MASPQIVMAGMANPELTSRLKDNMASSQTLGIIDVAAKLKVPVIIQHVVYSYLSVH